MNVFPLFSCQDSTVESHRHDVPCTILAWLFSNSHFRSFAHLLYQLDRPKSHAKLFILNPMQRILPYNPPPCARMEKSHDSCMLDKMRTLIFSRIRCRSFAHVKMAVPTVLRPIPRLHHQSYPTHPSLYSFAFRAM
jgi:hypothetical protein